MAEKIVSPGVFTRENDQSYLAQGIGEIGAAVVGPFKKGPTFLPTVINTQSEFEKTFGTPDGTYYSGFTVQNYLKESGTVTVVRVGHLGGYEHIKPYGIVADDIIIGTLMVTDKEGESTGIDISGEVLTDTASDSKFAISGSLTGDVTLSTDPAASNNFGDFYGRTAKSTKGVYAYNYFENASSNVGVPTETVAINLPTQDFTQDYSAATTPWILSQDFAGERSQLFRFITLGEGNIYNKEYKISISNVIPGKNDDFPTFSVTIRSYDDTDKKKSYLETFNKLNMNPASPNYIAKVIGDMNISIDSSGKITENGDFQNNSSYVRVEVSPEGSFPDKAGPFGHSAYLNPIFTLEADEDKVPPVLTSTSSLSNSSTNSTSFSGIDLETVQVRIDNNLYLAPLPTGVVSGLNVDFTFENTPFSFELTGSKSEDVNKRQFTLAFQGGFDGISPTVSIDSAMNISAKNSHGFNLSEPTSSGTVAYSKAINALSNPDEWDFNLVVAPGIIRSLHTLTFDSIVEMVENREDAFFIGDVTAAGDSIKQAIAQGDDLDSNYVGTYYPWVKILDPSTNKLIPVPPSVLMPRIYAANDNIAAEWWAPAGLNRGGIVGASSVLNRLTHAERDDLYEGKINPIATFPGEGIVAFGQKTLQEANSALDRINVRRLLIKVKKYIASTSRYLVFENNTQQTRNKFLNTVNPYLEGIQQRQGLYTFKVVMDESNNTPDVVDRNIMVGQIYLQPTKSAEFIVLDFNIMPSGATFSA